MRKQDQAQESKSVREIAKQDRKSMRDKAICVVAALTELSQANDTTYRLECARDAYQALGVKPSAIDEEIAKRKALSQAYKDTAKLVMQAFNIS